jgi:hypothetical protein
MPCCADAAAASPSAAALRRCGCAQCGSTPLHDAAHNGQVACVALLVERGANNKAKDEVRCAAPSPAATRVPLRPCAAAAIAPLLPAPQLMRCALRIPSPVVASPLCRRAKRR